MVKTIFNHFQKFKYLYGLIIMSVLSIHSFIMWALSDQMGLFVFSMIEGVFAYIVGIEYEKETKNKEKYKDYIEECENKSDSPLSYDKWVEIREKT